MSNRRRKLAILGTAYTWKHAPWEDPDYDIWGINALFLNEDWKPKYERRVNAWFELHHPDDFSFEPKERLDWLCTGKPFTVFAHDTETARAYGSHAVAFPREQVEYHFTRGYYHAGTFDWLVAYALFLGEYHRIEFYGMYGMIEGEPPSARPCLEYWIGLAEGQAVEVAVPDESDILMNVELRGAQYAYARGPVDGLGILTQRSGIVWQNADFVGRGVKIGHEGVYAYLRFPAWEQKKLDFASFAHLVDEE